MSTKNIIATKQVIPEEYTPHVQIDFCSNRVENYQFLIDDDGFYPILIGEGDIPRIWLYSKLKNKGIITLVEDSVSNLDQLKVNIFNSRKYLEIQDITTRETILGMQYAENVKITQLNLKPLGYNITGNENGLHMGANTISGSGFMGVNAVIGFGRKK